MVLYVHEIDAAYLRECQALSVKVTALRELVPGLHTVEVEV